MLTGFFIIAISEVNTLTNIDKKQNNNFATL